MPAEVWELDLSSQTGRLDRAEVVPANCGIGAHRLLISDPKSAFSLAPPRRPWSIGW